MSSELFAQTKLVSGLCDAIMSLIFRRGSDMPDNFSRALFPRYLGATAGCQSTALLGSPVCLLATTGLSVPLGIVEPSSRTPRKRIWHSVRGFGRASRYGSWSCQVQGSLRSRGHASARWREMDAGRSMCEARFALSSIARPRAIAPTPASRQGRCFSRYSRECCPATQVDWQPPLMTT